MTLRVGEIVSGPGHAGESERLPGTVVEVIEELDQVNVRVVINSTEEVRSYPIEDVEPP